MTLDFLEKMDQDSLLDIIKRASIKLNNAPQSKVEVVQKQDVFGVSKGITKLHNGFNKILAFNNNVAGITKAIERGDARTLKQGVSEKRTGGVPEQNEMNADLPDLGSALDDLTQALENLNLTSGSGGGLSGVAAGAAGGMLAGRGGLLRTGLKVAGVAAAGYGAYKVAGAVLPSMMGSDEPKPKQVVPVATPTGTREAKNQSNKLLGKATAALNQPTPERKQQVAPGGFGSRFADYIGSTFKNVTDYISSIPEQLANLGSQAVQGVQDAGAAVQDFAEGVVGGYNEPTGDKANTMKVLYDSFLAQGLTSEGAKTMVAQIGRENGFQPKHLFGTHVDDSNQAVNVGMFSWQGDRGNNILKFMKRKGLVDNTGKIVNSDTSLIAQAEFAVSEMKNTPSYAKSYKAVTTKGLEYKDIEATVGDNYVRWRRTDPKYSAGGYRNQNRAYAQISNIVSGAGKAGRVVGEAIGGAISTITGKGQFITPVIGKKIGSPFGMRMHPTLNVMKMHEGVDFRHGGESNPPIFASAAGTVVHSGTSGGYGTLIQIAHAGGYFTRYGHLSSMKVRKGEKVNQGQQIGIMGTTGRSTGVHLHFEIRKGNTPLNPEALIVASREATTPKQASAPAAAQAGAIARRKAPTAKVRGGSNWGKGSPPGPVIAVSGGNGPLKPGVKRDPARDLRWYLGT